LYLWVFASLFYFKVIFLDGMLSTQVKMKRNCLNIVTALHVLLHTLSSSRRDSSGVEKNCGLSLKEAESFQVLSLLFKVIIWFFPGICFINCSGNVQVFVQLGAMVNKVSEFGLLGWFGRVKLINCICDLVLLNPQTGQVRTSHFITLSSDLIS